MKNFIISLLTIFGSLSVVAVPNQIKVQSISTCAVVNDEVRCWGEGYKYDSRPFKNLSLAKQVSLGIDFACALTTNPVEPVQCWGRVPGVMPIGLNHVSEIAAGADHVCVLSEDKVICWGSNGEGQLDVPKNLPPIRSIGAASDYTCALSQTGDVTCWGEKQPHVKVPSGLHDVVQISSGWPDGYAPSGHMGAHVCALLKNGSIVCWGNNTYGELNVPLGLKKATKVVAGKGFSCAVLEDRSVNCWGEGIKLPSTPINDVVDIAANSQLCVSTTQETTCYGNTHNWINPPAFSLNGLSAADFSFFCGLNNSKVYCFGHFPVLVPNTLANIKHVAISEYGEGGCVFDKVNSSSCWGKSEYTSYDFPSDINQASDIKIWRHGYGCAVIGGVQKCWSIYKDSKIGPKIEMKNVKKIFTGSGASCLLFNDETISCYTENQVEIKTPKLSNVVDVVINETYGCALARGLIECWGDENEAPGIKNRPAYLNASRIVAGTDGSNMCAIVGGRVYCWSMLTYANPLPAPPSDVVGVLDLSISPTSISSSGHACALMKDGIRCWGRDDFGQAKVPADLLSF